MQRMQTSFLSRLRGKIQTSAFEDYTIIKRLSKNFTIGISGSFFLLVIALGRTALLTKSLSLSDYGRVMIVINIITFLSAFLSIRVNDAIYRFYPELEQAGDIAALRGFLWLSLLLSLVVGLLVAVGLFLLAPWIVSQFYSGDDVLVKPLRIFALVALLLAFEGFSTAILRIKDRFLAIVLPQVIGSIITIVILIIYFSTANFFQIDVIIGAFTVGFSVQLLLPLIQSVRANSTYLFSTEGGSRQALLKYKRTIMSTLFHSNLTGYLTLLDRGGAIFLLGLISTPAEVALYSLADQLTKPLLMLQNNIQTAVTPEIVSLWASRKLKKLYRFVLGYVIVVLIIGSFALVAAMILAKPIILLFSKIDYLAALPTFNVLITTVYILVAAVPFYILSITMDKLRQRNAIIALKFVYLIIVIVFTDLNAMTMAAVLLLGELTVRILHDIPLLHTLRRITHK